jgi:two-component system sensor histidine kinase BaeS
MSRLWLPAQAFLIAGLCSVVAGLVEWHFARHAESRTDWFLALGVPLVACSMMAGFVTWYWVRQRRKVLIAACRRIADGDWAFEWPGLGDPSSLTFRDALRSMADSLAEATGRLKHVDAQRRRFFADLAHELATPISTVLGIADALENGERFDNADRARLVVQLQHEAACLQHLAADVRNLALLDDPDTRIELSRTDVGQLAQSAVERAALTTPEIHFAARVESAPCDADPQRMDQVLTNLLSNAARYTPPGGRVEVAVARAGSGVRLVVEDSGAGVPDQDLPRLGQRLFRVDIARNRKTGGHGLGLSIVAAIVARHDGRLSFEHAELGGLRVTIELPAERVKAVATQSQ